MRNGRPRPPAPPRSWKAGAKPLGPLGDPTAQKLRQDIPSLGPLGDPPAHSFRQGIPSLGPLGDPTAHSFRQAFRCWVRWGPNGTLVPARHSVVGSAGGPTGTLVPARHYVVGSAGGPNGTLVPARHYVVGSAGGPNGTLVPARHYVVGSAGGPNGTQSSGKTFRRRVCWGTQRHTGCLCFRPHAGRWSAAVVQGVQTHPGIDPRGAPPRAQGKIGTEWTTSTSASTRRRRPRPRRASGASPWSRAPAATRETRLPRPPP